MKYFGTDGIRGIVNENLDKKLISKVARAIALKLYEMGSERIVVGADSRESGDYILSELNSNLLRHGINVDYVGIVTSPALAFITKKFNYPLGLMISASHNPHQFNGLKFFSNAGEKVSDEFDADFENKMESRFKLKSKFARFKFEDGLVDSYVEYLKSIKKGETDCIFDCANGASAKICARVYPHQRRINCHPNGSNINLDAGCTHIEGLVNMCKREKKCGFAFDGDADRICMVSSSGEVLNGDKILFLLSKFFLGRGDVLVGTIYTDEELNVALNKRGIRLIRADVGDKKVAKLMKESRSLLGGEDSGHIIFSSHMPTGDGLLIACIIMNILSSTHESIEELIKDYHPHHQERKNLKLSSRFELNERTKEKINNMERAGARVVVRPSGTEPVLRLFVEHEEKESAMRLMDELVDMVKRETNELP